MLTCNRPSCRSFWISTHAFANSASAKVGVEVGRGVGGALRSTLTATQGPVRIIGNVAGRRNWAYQLARRAEADEPYRHYAKITAYDAIKAGVLAQEEVEDARRNLSERVFRELYLAESADSLTLVYSPFGPRERHRGGRVRKRHGRIYVGYDWGFTDPTHIGLLSYLLSFGARAYATFSPAMQL